MSGFQNVGYGPLLGVLAGLLYAVIYMGVLRIRRKRKEKKPLTFSGNAQPSKFHFTTSKAVGSTRLTWRRRCIQWLSRLWKRRRHEIKPVVFEGQPMEATANVSKAELRVGRVWIRKLNPLLVITALLVSLLAVVVTRPVMNWIQKQGKSMEVSNDLMRTKPICGSTCKNFAWVVERCTREADKIGSLHSLWNKPKRATSHFRGCLINRGMDWKPCKKGEPGCRLFRYTGLRSPVANPPTFED